MKKKTMLNFRFGCLGEAPRVCEGCRPPGERRPARHPASHELLTARYPEASGDADASVPNSTGTIPFTNSLSYGTTTRI